MKTILKIMLLIVFVGFTNSFINAQNSYCFGDCRVRMQRQFRDIKINRINFSNYHCRYGWRTQLAIDGRGNDFISGDYVNSINRFLYDLYNNGYYTVNIYYHASGGTGGGGFYIEGSRNSIQEEKAAQQRSYRNSQYVKNTYVSRNSNQQNGSYKKTPVKKKETCRVYLYTSIFKSDSRERADIKLAGEYINVFWDPTHYHAGQRYSNKLYLQDINGNKRELTNGQNWVAPGRYQLLLRYSNIISTSVTVKYDCYK
jgi:hypothetical protein